MNTPRTYAKSPELEAAVIADPENDLPRLVYADWLDEHDDPHRAAFIRAQCALWDKNPAADDYPDWVESRAEAGWALRYRTDLAPQMPEGIEFHDSIFHRDDEFNSYHRGFPYFIKTFPNPEPATLRALGQSLSPLFKTTTIRGLNLEEHNEAVLSNPAAKAVSAIQAANYMSTPRRLAWATAITKSPAVRALRWLHLSCVKGLIEAELFAKASFDSLTRFDPGAVGGPPAVFTKLFGAPWMEHVRRMAGHPGELTQACSRRFVAGIASLPSLHTLRAPPSDELIQALGGGAEFQSLASLEMTTGRDYRLSVAPLAGARFPLMRSFSLTGQLKDAEAVGMIGSEWFARLNRLSLNCPKLGDKAVLALAKSAASTRLRHLYLNSNVLTEQSFDAFVHGFGSLSWLSLNATHMQTRKIDAATLAKFLARYANPNLRSLAISGWPLNDKGAGALAKNPTFASLRSLDIDTFAVTWKGIKAILSSPHLQGLRALELGLSEYTPKDKKTLAKIAEVLKDPGVMPHLVGWR